MKFHLVKIGIVLLLSCVVIMVLSTFAFPEPFRVESKLLVWENWREPLHAEPGSRGLGDYRLLAALILAAFIVLYFIFR